jgi:hypothetical protein
VRQPFGPWLFNARSWNTACVPRMDPLTRTSLLFAAWMLPLSAQASKRDRLGANAAPSASASEIPALAKLLEKAQWEPTPELSGVYRAGHVFEVTELGHRPLTTSCIEATPSESPYTAADLIVSLQSGVRMGGLGARGEVTGEVVKKIKFGTPVQESIPTLELVLTPQCASRLQRTLSKDRIAQSYVVQEVLRAEIAEQTCGRVDASGRIVGLGASETELSVACAQASLDPVAVGYRTVPLSDLLRALPRASGGVVVVGGSTGGAAPDIDALEAAQQERIAAEQREQALREELERARRAKFAEASAAQQAAASAQWADLDRLRSLGGPEAETAVKDYIRRWSGARVRVKDSEGTHEQAVSIPELRAAERWLAAQAPAKVRDPDQARRAIGWTGAALGVGLGTWALVSGRAIETDLKADLESGTTALEDAPTTQANANTRYALGYVAIGLGVTSGVFLGMQPLSDHGPGLVVGGRF